MGERGGEVSSCCVFFLAGVVGVFFFSEERGGKGVDEALGFLCERIKGLGD